MAIALCARVMISIWHEWSLLVPLQPHMMDPLSAGSDWFKHINRSQNWLIREWWAGTQSEAGCHFFQFRGPVYTWQSRRTSQHALGSAAPPGGCWENKQTQLIIDFPDQWIRVRCERGQFVNDVCLCFSCIFLHSQLEASLQLTNKRLDFRSFYLIWGVHESNKHDVSMMFDFCLDYKVYVYVIIKYTHIITGLVL